MNFTYINTTDGAIVNHVLTDDERVHLEQIIDIDGDTVIKQAMDIKNGSGRVVGESITITPATPTSSRQL